VEGWERGVWGILKGGQGYGAATDIVREKFGSAAHTDRNLFKKKSGERRVSVGG